MYRLTVRVSAGLGVLILTAASMTGSIAAQHASSSRTVDTNNQKIANAMSAAPASVAAKAAVLDWPAKEGAQPATLRQGSNGWTCFPDMPDTRGNDPMCLDQTWMAWMDAYAAHQSPHVERIGLSYMIGPGGGWGSNTDPYASSEKPDNQWALDGPHLMIVVPDLKALNGLPTTRESGGPFVMFAGTPYAHIMVPIAPASSATPGALR